MQKVTQDHSAYLWILLKPTTFSQPSDVGLQEEMSNVSTNPDDVETDNITTEPKMSRAVGFMKNIGVCKLNFLVVLHEDDNDQPQSMGGGVFPLHCCTVS